MNIPPNRAPLKITFIHGFRVKDRGERTIDRLAKHFKMVFPNATIDTDSADYGRIGLLLANYFWRKPVKRIAETLKTADIVVTHSNGAHFCMRALAKINNENIIIIHYSPALNRNWPFKEKFKNCIVFHSPTDKVVGFASWVIFSAWGNMGKWGPTTKDKRVIALQPKFAKGHSGWFSSSRIKKVFSLTYKTLGRLL